MVESVHRVRRFGNGAVDFELFRGQGAHLGRHVGQRRPEGYLSGFGTQVGGIAAGWQLKKIPHHSIPKYEASAKYALGQQKRILHP
jgi:hypothetical protein